MIRNGAYFSIACPLQLAGYIVLQQGTQGLWVASIEEACLSLKALSQLGTVNDICLNNIREQIEEAWMMVPQVEDTRPFMRILTTLLNIPGTIKILKDPGSPIYVVCEAGKESEVRGEMDRLKKDPLSADDIRRLVEEDTFSRPFIPIGSRPAGQTLIF